MTTATSVHRVLVLGAGYAGMMTALRTARRTRQLGGEVTLVNPVERFVERLRMHQTATGQQLAEYRIPDLLDGTGITFVRGLATRIVPDRREVVVHTMNGDGARVLRYDTLVTAIGSLTDTGTVPGADVHACTLNGPDAAGVLAGRLPALADGGGTVVVCGGGLTGIESATEIAETWPGVQVELISRDLPGAMMGEAARSHLDRAFERLGIHVRTGVKITEVLPDGLRLGDGGLVPADAALWTGGVRVPPLAAEAGLATDEYGRIITDPTLRSVTDPRVYAVGDAAAVCQAYGVMHGTCQSGIPTAAYAADAITLRLRGSEPKPFRFGYLHQPVSLGRRDAVIQFTHGDDTPRRWHLTGRPAVAYKETVSASPIPAFRLSRHLTLPTHALWTRGGHHNRPARQRT